MKDRKLQVIEKAHQLFIEKGFQATSIQDILDFSGISKGTFYNYFSSKNELIIAIFKTIFKNMDMKRNELLIGQDPSDIEIFIKQMELQMKTNKKNKLFTLFEEVLFSNDEELKEFLKRGQLMMLRWVYSRFLDIFGEEKKPFMIDCSIMFMGMLQLNLHFDYLANGTSGNINRVVRYSVERLVKMVDEVAEAGEQLLEPELLEKWLPDCQKRNHEIKSQLLQLGTTMRKTILKTIPFEVEQEKYLELIDFVQDELLQTRAPRKFLIESAVTTLKAVQENFLKKELLQLEQLILSYFSQEEELL